MPFRRDIQIFWTQSQILEDISFLRNLGSLKDTTAPGYYKTLQFLCKRLASITSQLVNLTVDHAISNELNS